VLQVVLHTHVIVGMSVTTTIGGERQGRRSSHVTSRVPSNALHPVALQVKVTILIADVDNTLTMVTEVGGGGSARMMFTVTVGRVASLVARRGNGDNVEVGTGGETARAAGMALGRAVEEDGPIAHCRVVGFPGQAPADEARDMERPRAPSKLAAGPTEPASRHAAAGQDECEVSQRASRSSADVTSRMHSKTNTSGEVGSGATPPGNSITTEWFNHAAALGPEMYPLAQYGSLHHQVPI
jgi:hypothetical protein